VRIWLVVLLCVWVLPNRGFSSPTAEELVEKFVAACEDPSINAKRNEFAYRRASQVNYLDAQGKSKNKVERIYQIKPVDGEPVTKLLMINGKPAVEKEETQRSAARQTGEKSRTLHFTKELMGRYQFRLGEDTRMDGRVLYVLHFSPRPGAESNGFFDKLINAMHGTLWIDQEDSQLMKADIHLGQKISFFGGIAGAIEKLDLSLVQKRLEPGVWLPQFTFIDFDGRKLLSDLRFQCIENCAEFHKVTVAQSNSNTPGKSLE